MGEGATKGDQHGTDVRGRFCFCPKESVKVLRTTRALAIPLWV